MSLMITFLFAMLLPYAALTIRRQVWARGVGGGETPNVLADERHPSPRPQTAFARLPVWALAREVSVAPARQEIAI
jgi:hypothetical protein